MFPDPWCTASPCPELDIDDVDPRGQVMFCIITEFEYTWEDSMEDDQDEEGSESKGLDELLEDGYDFMDHLDVAHREAELYVPRDLLLDKSCGPMILSNIHSAMGVPERDRGFFTERTLACARSMADNDINSLSEFNGGKVLPMTVFVSTHLNDVEELRLATEGRPSKERFSIKGLRKVDMKGGEAGTRCSICLEDMPVGSEAVELHCSHVYHHNCIFTWLLKTGTCPLCRHAT